MSENGTSAHVQEPSKPSSPVLRSRRAFLIGLAAALGGGWLGAVLHRLFLAAPRTVEPARLRLADLPPGGQVTISYAGRPALVRWSADGQVEALSLICTHLGCTVEWQEENQGFRCPCHEGKFDAEGRAIAGPPKLPLQRLRVRREGDILWIGERL
ncbi:MAG: ubiquinol-cytochrome c reductase iron-sulfur subunit [Anaerolineae bacterium]